MPDVHAARYEEEALLVECPCCGGRGTVGGRGACVRTDRPWWPDMPCVFTPDCPGVLLPEAIN